MPDNLEENHILINAYPLNPYIMRESYQMKVEKEGDGLQPSLNIPVRDSWYSSKLAVISEKENTL